MEKKKKLNWDEIVFEFRNKSYGAYYLKQKTVRDLIISNIAGILILFLSLVPVYISQFQEEEEIFDIDNTISVDLMSIMPEENELPPPPELPLLKEVLEEVNPQIVVVDKTTEPVTIPTTDQLKDSIKNDAVEDTAASSSKGNTDGAYGYYTIEERPEFTEGGIPGLLRWIAKNTKYPQEAYNKGIRGKIIVQFIIDTEGNVTEVELKNNVNPLLDSEAMRVVKSMPKWKPGKQRGKPVRVIFQIPINFTYY